MVGIPLFGFVHDRLNDGAGIVDHAGGYPFIMGLRPMTDAFGNPYDNRGVELERVEKVVMESLREHEEELFQYWGHSPCLSDPLGAHGYP